MSLWWFMLVVLLARTSDACVRSKDADHDQTPVVQIHCPKDITMVAANRSTRALVEWNRGNFSIQSTHTIRKVYQTVPVYGASTEVRRLFEEGRHVVEYKAVDENGVHGTCSFHVTVKVIRCEQLYNPQFGNLTCEAENLLHSRCHSACIPGYSLLGHQEITCGHDGQWSHDKPMCRVTTCPDPGTPIMGSRTCSTTIHQFGSECVFRCHRGYHLDGASRLLCLATGWSHSTPYCQEMQAPRAEICPRDIHLTSGKDITQVEKPTIKFVTALGVPARYLCTHFNNSGYHNFSLGVHRVTCTAWDPDYGDQASVTCHFTVTIRANPCRTLAKPVNGYLMCSRYHGGANVHETTCQLYCNRGHVPARTDYIHHNAFVCDHTGHWHPSHHVPSCVLPERPQELQLPCEIFYITNSCSNTTVLKDKFKTALKQLVRRAGPCENRRLDCLVENVEVSPCQPTSDHGRSLRRQSRSQHRHHLQDASLAASSQTSRNGRDLNENLYRMPVLFHLGTRLPPIGGEWPDEYHKAKRRLFAMFDYFELKLLDGSFSITENLSSVMYVREVTNSLTHAEKDPICALGYIFSKSLSLCVPCGAGTQYNDSLDRCSLCAKGQYQDEAGKIMCKPCPPGRTTTDEGASQVSQCVDIDECESNPCQHNGICQNTEGSYHCLCQPGHTGRHCEEAIYDCLFHNCSNDGTCVPEGRFNHSCRCRPGYSGYYCQRPTESGHWGEWSAWSQCSKSCEAGEQIRTRMCDSPPPNYERQAIGCPGEATEERVCNVHTCPTCKRLRRPYQGEINCTRNEEHDLTMCRISCLPGYGFAEPVYDVYMCGRNTSYLWPHESPDNARCVMPRCHELHPEQGEDVCSEQPCADVDFRFRSEVPVECSHANSGAIRRQFRRRALEATEGLPCIADGICVLQDPIITGCSHRRRRRRKRRRRRRDVTDHGIVVEVVVTYLGRSGHGGTKEEGHSSFASHVEKMNVTRQLEVLGRDLLEQTALGNLYIDLEGQSIHVSPDEIETSDVSRCPSGSVPGYGTTCVECQPGSFFTSEENACVLCSFGSYQPHVAQSSCIPCHNGFTTYDRGAVHSSQCVAGEELIAPVNPKTEMPDNDLKTAVVVKVVIAVLSIGALLGCLFYCRQSLVEKDDEMTPKQVEPLLTEQEEKDDDDKTLQRVLTSEEKHDGEILKDTQHSEKT